MKEKKALVEDALHATRAAVEEGIVPGGGVALLRAQASSATMKLDREDEQIGVQILRRALEHPIRQIAANAGVEGSIVVDTVRDGTGLVRLQRADGRVRGHGEGRRHRSDEGGALRAAERRVDRWAAPHDGSRRCGHAGCPRVPVVVVVCRTWVAWAA